MRRVMLVLTDGLRPDAITPTVMPSLHALGDAYTVARHARTIRPSVTVAAIASLATGVGADTHCLLKPGLDFLPRVARLRPIARELSRAGIPTDAVPAEIPLSEWPLALSLAKGAGVRGFFPTGRSARETASSIARSQGTRSCGSSAMA
ncbi:MAG: alkaline phosphatase family protein [Candidatus Methylomirabilaceae bacterium]